MHKIFISYSRIDYPSVFKIKEEIEKVIGKGTCWIDLTGIESDRQFIDVIIDAIDHADIFLFMYSKHSDQSEWTRKEIEYANSENKRIVFVRMDNTQLSKYFKFQFGGHDIIDINDNYQKQKLIENIATWCGSKEKAEVYEKKECGNNIQKTPRHQFLHKITKYYIIGMLLILSIILLRFGFILLFLFIFVVVYLLVIYYFLFHKNIQAKRHEYQRILSNIRLKSPNVQLFLNLIFLGLLILISYMIGYSYILFFLSILMLAINILLLFGVLFFSVHLGIKTKKEGLVYFGVPSLLYFLLSISILSTSTNSLESENQLNIDDSVISKNTESVNSDKYTTNVTTTDNDSTAEVKSDKSGEVFYLDGLYDNKSSVLWIRVSYDKRHIDGYLEKTSVHPELYISIHRNKRAIGGVVENTDGQNIGYLEGLCDITDSSISITGKIITESENYNYTEHIISYSGMIPL